MLKIKMKNAGRSIVACLTVLAMLACMVIPVMALGNYTFDEIISNNMAHEEPTIIYHKYGDYCTQHGEYINKKIGLENLPDDLQEVAVLRLANQQESMEELLKLSTINLTKSGLNHRFRRLIKIAEDLKTQDK